jgi:pyruvate dehydrogenase E1 component
MPANAREGIVKGMYKLKDAGETAQAQILASGTILREAIAAADLLERDFGVKATIWSVTSFTELRRDGLAKQRWNLLHPDQTPRVSYVEECLAETRGPVIAASDYIKMLADQIRPFVPRSYTVLGTDGFGRSDQRSELRRFFEVDRHYIAFTTLKALADEGSVAISTLMDAMAKYGIDPEKPNPVQV